jgi:hypothetical protein
LVLEFQGDLKNCDLIKGKIKFTGDIFKNVTFSKEIKTYDGNSELYSAIFLLTNNVTINKEINIMGS